MVLLANVHNALGARPRLSTSHAISRYPGRLPGGVEEQLTLHLRAFSLDQFRVVIDLEEPRNSLDLHASVAADVPTTTIGEFYTTIARAVVALGDLAFVGEPRRQVGPDLIRDAIAVCDVNSALRTLDTIVEQGEGTNTSPDESDSPSDSNDYAHYYRLTHIREGRALVRTAGDGSPYGFTGTVVPFDPDGVFALPDDPCARDYPVDSLERRAMDAVNYTYTSLLARVHDLVNGHADATCVASTLSLMTTLDHQARAMVNATAVPGHVLIQRRLPAESPTRHARQRVHSDGTVIPADRHDVRSPNRADTAVRAN